ncbi:uncharacterized protein L203_101908 [Cryptococcus depauperatus CBS 7841]|uniref:Uncharacterized protein n=1 Tax=Cryptococcus depauperatus CBS 7841 TaxID=1295531 RepID=A0A1E3IH77_9TREE|nr:hypothetical protein L203_03151 [Cryptococcus depauperatus CBS 7841]
MAQCKPSATSSLSNSAICTYALATFHYTTELVVFKYIKPNRVSIWPLVVGWTGLIWMLTQRTHYAP